jgi:DNA-binding ferritin-like protein
MSIENTLVQNQDEQIQQIEDFTQKQQEKIESLITDGNQILSEFKPFDKIKEIDSQTTELMQRVNDELEKAMAQVNEKMKFINQNAG